MRRSSFLAAILFCCFVVAAHAQSSRAKKSQSPAKPAASAKPTASASPTATAESSATSKMAVPAARPQFRPAVLGTSSDSLVNRIDVEDLLKKGQKDGAVQFAVLVKQDGTAEDSVTYHALPNCTALESEVGRQLTNARFTPPIYEHQPVKALLTGTVLFDATNKPHLRILLNQDPREIEQGNDFIAPQPVIGGDSAFTGLHAPPTLSVKINAVVNLVTQVNAQGTLVAAQVTSEEPPLLGLADAVVLDLQRAKFIPPFRDGDPADNETVMAICYTPADEAEPTKSEGFGLSAPVPPQPPQ